MSREEYAELPDSLTLREVRVRVSRKGFARGNSSWSRPCRPRKVSSGEIAKLYRRRWQADAEPGASLKVVLQMDHLRCKTPHRVRNEFYMHLVAYNLIRQTMAVAAARAGREPWTVSFKGTCKR